MLAREQIQQHINELDAAVPKEDADLLISYNADSAPDCEIIGNYIGYLRFGIEMLKAAVVELEPGAVATNISIGYMEVPRWSLHVKRFTRREDVRTNVHREFLARFPDKFTWKHKLTICYEVFLGIFVVLCLLIGFGEILVWVWHLVF
jgi:hypothetical protein